MSSPLAPHPIPAGQVTQAPGPLSPERRRLDAIDLLRGIVMVIMLLDHMRLFVFAGTVQYDPTDLTRTDAAVFFTRWITHFAAPVFVLLAGTGAYLQRLRGTSPAALSRFLFTRGLWLIVVEFVLVRGIVTFSFDPSFVGFAQVIWVIGVSMLVLAALVRLPVTVSAVFGIGMIALHNLLDGVQIVPPGEMATTLPQMIWLVLHQQGFMQFGSGGPVLFLVYPLIPWVGVMAAGYAAGALYAREAQGRRRLLLSVGIGVTVLFVALRLINAYGDPSAWTAQPDSTFTLLSFLNTTKYPPSLLFLAMTLGPSLIALAWFERLDDRGATARAPLRWLVVFGRVPLFFYLLQWLLAHVTAIALNVMLGRSAGYVMFGPPGPGFSPPDAGFPLWVVYASWLAGTVLLYFPCRWYAELKQRRGREWRWLSYM